MSTKQTAKKILTAYDNEELSYAETIALLKDAGHVNHYEAVTWLQDKNKWPARMTSGIPYFEVETAANKQRHAIPWVVLNCMKSMTNQTLEALLYDLGGVIKEMRQALSTV